MILTCPSCGTQYAVKDGAIPPGGRKVRCASCGQSWHQEGDESAPPAGPEQDAPPEEPHQEPPAQAPESDGGEETDTPQFDIVGNQVQAMEDVPPIAPGAPLVEGSTAIPVPGPDRGFGDNGQFGQADDGWDPAKEIPDAEEIDAVYNETGEDRRRSWWMAILLALALVAAIVVAFWFLAPDSLRQQFGLAAASPSPLQIAPGTPERQMLASGNELVVVGGRVINPSSREQQVPPIQAQLRDKSGKLVYSWTIAPPAMTLPPGGSASFNSAKMDVPASGAESTITLTLKS